MECSQCSEPISRTTAFRNKSGKGNTFCCYNCNSFFFSHRTMDEKHKKPKKIRRVKPTHRDFEE